METRPTKCSFSLCEDAVGSEAETDMSKNMGTSPKAALRGEPSYIWRAGQQRRFEMICSAGAEKIKGRVLEDGCGVGEYLAHLQPLANQAVGLDFEFERALQAHKKSKEVICSACEHLPFPGNYFDLVISHEVLEHVGNDQQSVSEIIRVIKPGGRLILFVPNRGYPFETHGIYWKGEYKFGNKLFVNYLPRIWRDKLAPHVRAYYERDLEKLFEGQNMLIVKRTIIFGGYDNIIARLPWLGRILRGVMQFLEHTPLKIFGLSHFWVVEINK